MVKFRVTEDIQSLTSFRANVASFIEQVRSTRRPLILTQHGRSAAVLLGASEYEELVEELELRRELERAEAAIDDGQGIEQAEVERQLRARLKERLAE